MRQYVSRDHDIQDTDGAIYANQPLLLDIVSFDQHISHTQRVICWQHIFRVVLTLPHSLEYSSCQGALAPTTCVYDSELSIVEKFNVGEADEIEDK